MIYSYVATWRRFLDRDPLVELARHGVREDAGLLTLHGINVAFHVWFDASEARARLPADASAATGCPELGEITGALAWEPMAVGDELSSELGPAIARCARGWIGRTEADARSLPADARWEGAPIAGARRVTLEELADRHGMDDGRAWLSRDRGYLEEMARRIELAAAAAGAPGLVDRVGGGDNPILFVPQDRTSDWARVELDVCSFDVQRLRASDFWSG